MAEQTVLPSSAKAAAWDRVRKNLRASAGQRLFDQWLRPMELIEESDAETVRLGLPAAFMTNWVRNHYAERLTFEFRSLLPEVRAVSIETIRAVKARHLTAVSPAPTPM